MSEQHQDPVPANPQADAIDATSAVEFFLAGARDAGMRHVCISPGSRSTPLAIAALRTAGLSTSIHLDERVSAFVALGRAAATGRPVGLICTSGTAAANFLPAVAEASLSHVPLIVMTADRPPEHQAWGVGQTFEQRGLYHRQVRHEFAMPVGGDGGENHAHRTGWRAVSTAVEQSGPVHINWPFRLSLEPGQGPQDIAPVFDERVPLRPFADPTEVESLTELLSNAENPVIIAGPQTLGPDANHTRSADAAERLCAAAYAAGVPILADALSGLRGPGRNALIAYPALATERADVDSLAADLVIHVGQTPTAKRIRLWWESLSATHVLIDPRSQWHDPSHLATHRFRSTPVALLAAALDDLTIAPDHLERWVTAGTTTARICAETRSASPTLDEPGIVAALSDHTTGDDLIVASSSMPVRDIDTYLPTDSAVQVYANRGVNGIDGVISTAAGIASARTAGGDRGRTFVLIGDVALIHDTGGVLDAARNGTRLTIVVPNNDGGGIFSFLPARNALDTETFDRLFQTPHGATFEFLASYPGVRHLFTDDLDATLADLDATSAGEAVTIIEIATSSTERAGAHDALIARIRT